MPRARVHTCKWCPHRTFNKEEHWVHIKTHLDPRKLLVCKSCPFVTEYKHHLEYHHRNHTGIKPFKCDRCDYQCVNKSMLKSHQKSHSPECPFSCTNCGYTTKYAHSLKMHFKKYHQDEHHDRIMNDVFGPKSNYNTHQDGSGSISPASTSTTSTHTVTGITSPTSASIYLIQEMAPANYPILDLRIESKIRAS